MEWKTVAVFISSTFNDMHAERDLLLKQVFPELAEWCAVRRLRLYDIDLRWGVTGEESDSKMTVEACLRGIDECRPFFLCFLGQRRGWVPGADHVSPVSLQRYPGLKERLGLRSMTELEIEHAFLEPIRRSDGGRTFVPEPAQHAVFFLRDDAYLSALGEAQLRIYTNRGAADETREDQLHRQFLERIRLKGQYVYDYRGRFERELYSPELAPFGESCAQGRLTDFSVGDSPLGRFVLEALKKQILLAFPERAEAAPRQLSAGEEEETVQARRLEELLRDTVPREEELAELDAYCAAPGGRPLYVTGAAGAGKSSLLSLFFERRRGRCAQAVLRYCGISSASTRWTDIWRGIDRLSGRSGSFGEEELAEELPRILERFCGNGKGRGGEKEGVLLVIDGVDELAEGISALASLPAPLPGNLRLILSFRSGTKEAETLLANAERTGSAAVCAMRPLGGRREIAILIEHYLEHYLKAMDEEQIDVIGGIPAAQSPLFLKILLTELRMFGSRRQLTAEIASFGESPRSAFLKVLAELEGGVSYTAVPPGNFVPAFLSLLACARGTIWAETLREAASRLFGNGETADAVNYYLRRLRPYLFGDGARVGISYQSLREAALERYSGRMRDAHLALAASFQNSDPVECLYHLRMADESEEIRKLTGTLSFLCRGVASSGAFALRAEIERCGGAANEEVRQCLERIASAVGSDAAVAAALFYKELSEPLRGQAPALCQAPWICCEPIPLSPPREMEEALMETVFTVEHSIQGFCLAEEAGIGFFLKGEAEIGVCDLRTGRQTGSASLSGTGRIRKICCSPQGECLAAAAENGALFLYRIAFSEGAKLLSCTKLFEDTCANLRFGGICAFGAPGGLVWQRPDGGTFFYREADGAVKGLCRTEWRLAGVFGGRMVWKRGREYCLRGSGAAGVCEEPVGSAGAGSSTELVSTARINACAELDGLLYIAVEDEKVLVAEENGNVLREIPISVPLVTLAVLEGEIFGANRFGAISKITREGVVLSLGAIAEGDDILDVSTQLLRVGEQELCFFSMQRRAVLRTAGGRSARILRAVQGRCGLSVFWRGRGSFFVSLAGGREASVPYPPHLLVGTNVNRLNNLKAACSDETLVYESKLGRLRVLTGAQETSVDAGFPICALEYSPAAGSFVAVTFGAEFLELSAQGRIISRVDLPRSGSGVYLLCCCGTRRAVLSRRVQIKESEGASAVIEDVLSLIDGRRIAWTKRFSLGARGGSSRYMAYDRGQGYLLVLFNNRIERLSLKDGSCCGERKLDLTFANFLYGAAEIDGRLFVWGEEGETRRDTLRALSLDGNGDISLPSQRRIKGIACGNGCVLVQEGDERLYRVTVAGGAANGKRGN